jgi:putative membrane protein
MHPAYVILNALGALFVIAIAVFSGLMGSTEAYSFLADSGVAGIGFLIIAVVFILALGTTLLVSYVYYKRFLWEITESEINIRSGIIFKKQVQIPFQRVQSIDFNANPIERILGIVRLKIETAGGAQNRGVMIPSLKLAQAEALRAEVFARKRSFSAHQEAALRQKMEATKAAMASKTMPAEATRFDPQTGIPVPLVAPSSADSLVNEIGNEVGGLRGIFADDYTEEAPIEYEYGLSAKELLLSAISGDHHLVLLVIFLTLIPQAPGFIDFLSSYDITLGSLIDSPFVVVMAIVIAVVAIIFIMAMGVLGTAISYGGFKARRRGGRIEVERGLISRQYKGVAINRVQSVEINQGLIRRLLGYAELKLHTVDSLDTNQNQQNTQYMQSRGLVIHPFVKANRADDILMHLLPEYSGRPSNSEFKTLPKVALRRVIIRHTVFLTGIYGLIALAATLVMLLSPLRPPEQWITWLLVFIWAIFVVLLIVRFIASILWYRHAAYVYNDTMLMLRQGFFGQETMIIPRQKIQWAQSRQNPFQKLARVASITARTAAGISGTSTKLRDVTAEEAIAYLDWIRPRTKA